MACRLCGAKPLSEPMLYYCQLDPSKQTPVKLYSKFKHFHSRKCIWKCLKNVSHSVSASIYVCPFPARWITGSSRLCWWSRRIPTVGRWWRRAWWWAGSTKSRCRMASGSIVSGTDKSSCLVSVDTATGGDFDGLVQDCSISRALAMEILQSCTKPWKCGRPHEKISMA